VVERRGERREERRERIERREERKGIIIGWEYLPKERCRRKEGRWSTLILNILPNLRWMRERGSLITGWLNASQK
jgi:hypothetical protein